MSKKIIFSFMLGLALGVLITPYALANGDKMKQNEHEWCFRQEYSSIDELNEQNTLPLVLVVMNGNRAQVYTKCMSTPLPHRYAP